MTMWAEYLREREGKNSVIWHGEGFAVYKINNDEDRTCYIEHIYVVPEKRGKKIFSGLCDEVAVRAKRAGCRFLLGTVFPGSKGDTHSMKVQLAYGFALDRIEGKLIVLKMKL